MSKIVTNNIYWIPSIRMDALIKKNGVIYYSLLYYGAYSSAAAITIYFTLQFNKILIFFLANLAFLPFYSILTNIKSRLNFEYNIGRIRFEVRPKNMILKSIAVNNIFGF